MPENEKTRLQKFMGGGKQGYQIAFQMAWPAVMESFFIALAGMVDSLMVSSIGAYAVAAVGLTTQPKYPYLPWWRDVAVRKTGSARTRFS